MFGRFLTFGWLNKAPAVAETEYKRPLHRNRVSVRFPRRHTHRCGSTHPAVGWPATARPPPDLTQSAAASAPHTCRAAHALRPTHHSHPTIFAPPLQQRTLLHYSFVIERSTARQVDARTTICDACPPRDGALRSRWLGAALGQEDLVPLVERVGDHGRSRRRTRSAAAGLESLELVQRGL